MTGRLLALAAPAALLALAGCASFSPDGGIAAVSELARERTGQAVALQRSSADSETAATRAAEILAGPLTADGAVEIAFLRNRGLQESLARVGVAEADLVRAGRLRNPVFHFGRLALGGGAVEIERSLVLDVVGLLTMPLERRVQQGAFDQSQLEAAADAVALAEETRRAWVAAVAARQLVAYAAQVKDAADAANELARRMVQAGNVNRLAQMREQAFYADATAAVARAQHAELAARERLTRRLGLESDSGIALPERLPDLPAAPTLPDDAERTALASRLDVRMARRATETTARSLGLSRVTGFVDGLELGLQNRSETGEPRASGFELALPIPLFDWGVATRRAEATYLASAHRTADVAIRARSEVREAWSAYRTAWDLARHQRDEVVPLRQRIAAESLLRYNGMLIGVFDLLVDAREQVRAVTEAVETLRDFWIAEGALRTAVTAGPPATPSPTATLPAAAAPSRSGGH